MINLRRRIGAASADVHFSQQVVLPGFSPVVVAVIIPVAVQPGIIEIGRQMIVLAPQAPAGDVFVVAA